MPISDVIIRDLATRDGRAVWNIAYDNWGAVAADRAAEQMAECFQISRYAPRFFVAEDQGNNVVGFAAYQRSMRMHGAFDLIWLAVAESARNSGIGGALTAHRIAEIKKQGGSVISLVTQRPAYFRRFGFGVAAYYGHDWVEMVRVLKPAGME